MLPVRAPVTITLRAGSLPSRKEAGQTIVTASGRCPVLVAMQDQMGLRVCFVPSIRSDNVQSLRKANVAGKRVEPMTALADRTPNGTVDSI